MNGVSPVFDFNAICYKGSRQGEAAKAAADEGDARTLIGRIQLAIKGPNDLSVVISAFRRLRLSY